MNSSDILCDNIGYSMPTFCGGVGLTVAISSIEKYVMWVIIKYLHQKNGSFEIYPAPHFNLSLHHFSQFPLDV